MQTQSLSETQKLEMLIDFFDTFKIKTFPTCTSEDKEALHVIDERQEDWTVLYTVSIDNDLLVINDYRIITPEIEMIMNGDLKLKVVSKDNRREIISVEWYNVKPIIHQLNEFVLQMLLEKPAFFIGYSALINTNELDMKFKHDIANKLWNYQVHLDTEGLELLKVTANKLEKGE